MVAYANKITPTEVAYFLIQKFHDFSILIEDFQNFILKTAADRIKNDFINMDNNARLIKLFSKQIIEKQQAIIDNYIKQLELLHPENILKRGFSITYHKGKVITDSNNLQNEDLIVTQYYKGKTESIIKQST